MDDEAVLIAKISAWKKKRKEKKAKLLSDLEVNNFHMKHINNLSKNKQIVQFFEPV